MNQNEMKFQQIQNSLPLNSNILRPSNKGKYVKSRVRTRTIMKAGPTISGSLPNLNENHMNVEMLVESIHLDMVDEDMASYRNKFLNELNEIGNNFFA